MPCLQIERRQVVDVPTPRLLVQEHHAEQKQCPSCQQITAAPFPPGVEAPLQYGMRLGAIAVYLVQQQLLPWGRACEVLSDLVGAQISEGTLACLMQRCAANLHVVETHIKDALAQAEVLHQDETGLSVTGRRYWMHVACTDQLTHYAVHAKRGQEALEAIGILPRFTGTSVHDGWRSYFRYPCLHALCLVHLLRELTYLSEEQGLEWAADLIALLLCMKEATEQAREQGHAALHPLEVADWQAQFVALVAQADATTPCAQAPPGHKGRVKQSAARNLLTRRPCWPSCTASSCLLTTIKPSVMCAWLKSSKKSRARFAVKRARWHCVASAATYRPCASKACICLALWRLRCAAIPSFLHSRRPELLQFMLKSINGSRREPTNKRTHN